MISVVVVALMEQDIKTTTNKTFSCL